MAFAMLWNVTVCFSKLSVLLMYTSLFPVKSCTRWAQGIGGVIILWNVSDILAALLVCRPIARNWDFTIPGTCGSQPNFYLSMGIVNIISDVFILALPLPYLYELKLAWKKKLLAMSMLSIGVGYVSRHVTNSNLITYHRTWVITIYRQTLLPGLNFQDMTYDGVLATLLSGLEPSVAIALACIPLMRPLFPSHRRARNQSSQYHYGSGNDSGMYSNAKRGAIELHTNDGDSEVELQPQKPSADMNVQSSTWIEGHGNESLDGKHKTAEKSKIQVETRWEIRTHNR